MVQSTSELTPKIIMASLKALIAQVGGSVTLSQALTTVREQQPKRARLVYSVLPMPSGALELHIRNLGGSMLHPLVLIVEDYRSKHEFVVKLNAGCEMTVPLNGFYGDTLVRRKKGGVVIIAKSPARPPLTPKVWWSPAGDQLVFEVVNEGPADMTATATVTATQNEETLFVQGICLIAGQHSGQVFLRPEQFVEGGELAVLIENFNYTTIPLPPRPKPRVDVSSGVRAFGSDEILFTFVNTSAVELPNASCVISQSDGESVAYSGLIGLKPNSAKTVSVEASRIDAKLPIRIVILGALDTYVGVTMTQQLPQYDVPAVPLVPNDWSVSAPYWGAEGISVDITNGSEDSHNANVVFDTVPQVSENMIHFNPGETRTVSIPNHIAEGLAPSRPVKMWINDVLVTDFLAPAGEESEFSVEVMWRAGELILVVTRISGRSEAYLYIVTQLEMTIPGEYLKILPSQSTEFVIPHPIAGVDIDVWIDADQVEVLTVPEQPASEAEAAAPDDEAAYM